MRFFLLHYMTQNIRHSKKIRIKQKLFILGVNQLSSITSLYKRLVYCYIEVKQLEVNILASNGYG